MPTGHLDRAGLEGRAARGQAGAGDAVYVTVAMGDAGAADTSRGVPTLWWRR